jgi:hypothetical protein
LPETKMSFRWEGLRARRMVFFASLVLLLPIAWLLGTTLAPLLVAPGVLGLLGASLLAVAAWHWLLAWPCPRCRTSFARRAGQVTGRPFPRYCVQCRLPEWATAQDAVAPPEPVPSARAEGRVDQPTAVPLDRPALLHRRHRRVGYALAGVALYVGFCHLPAGRAVTTPSGRQIEFLSLTQHVQINTATGRSRNLLLQYYTPTPGDTAEAREVLALALDAARQTGDTVIVVEQINGQQRWRWLGIRIARIHRYRKTAAGDWHSGA